MVRKAPAAQEPAWQPDRRQWHFDKRLSLDTIVAVLGVAVVIGGPILVWGRAMEGRVQVLEVIQAERSKTEGQRDSDLRDQRAQLAGRLDKLDEKVTQLQITVGQLLPFGPAPNKAR